MRASDEDLMKRCREGDMSAFELIVLRYKDAIFNFIYHFLADYHRAQDISQETFLRVFRNADRYKSRNSFKSWIYRIAANLCKNELRDRSRHKELLLDDPAVYTESRYTSPDKAYEDEEVQRLVKEAVNSLPEDQRMAIVMREYQDMTYEEIASALNCSLGAVKSKIYRARQNIKRMLVEAEVS
jgi:RNA polymerase sigma-70 factor (ECF subfamily)